jgi:hypothetical protein
MPLEPGPPRKTRDYDGITVTPISKRSHERCDVRDFQSRISLRSCGLLALAKSALKALAPEPGLMPQAQASLAASSCKVQTEPVKQADAPPAAKR